MKKDQAIEEIRSIRHEISEKFGHDTKALLDHYKELEKKYADRILSTPYYLKKSKVRYTTLISSPNNYLYHQSK